MPESCERALKASFEWAQVQEGSGMIRDLARLNTDFVGRNSYASDFLLHCTLGRFSQDGNKVIAPEQLAVVKFMRTYLSMLSAIFLSKVSCQMQTRTQYWTWGEGLAFRALMSQRDQQRVGCCSLTQRWFLLASIRLGGIVCCSRMHPRPG